MTGISTTRQAGIARPVNTWPNRGAAFAFVSTNSISQGQPVPSLFRPLFDEGWRIRFAHRTFAWDAQSTDNAHVHVVIVGMDKTSEPTPILFEYTDIDGGTSRPHRGQHQRIPARRSERVRGEKNETAQFGTVSGRTRIPAHGRRQPHPRQSGGARPSDIRPNRGKIREAVPRVARTHQRDRTLVPVACRCGARRNQELRIPSSTRGCRQGDETRLEEGPYPCEGHDLMAVRREPPAYRSLSLPSQSIQRPS